MRRPVTEEKLREFFVQIGRLARSPGRVYIVGGATAVLLKFRPMTIDIDLKLAPEPEGVFEAIAELKESLEVNVELASPDDFIPALPMWQERSEFIGRFGEVDVFHMDFYSQALAKVQRGSQTDLEDAKGLVRLGKVDPGELFSLYVQIRAGLIRYPAIEAAHFDSQVQSFLQEVEAERKEI